MTDEIKRLMRSLSDKKVAGVCGGVGKYLGIDSTLVRIVMLLLAFLGGSGLLIYLIMWICMPEGE